MVGCCKNSPNFADDGPLLHPGTVINAQLPDDNSPVAAELPYTTPMNQHGQAAAANESAASTPFPVYPTMPPTPMSSCSAATSDVMNQLSAAEEQAVALRQYEMAAKLAQAWPHKH